MTEDEKRWKIQWLRAHPCQWLRWSGSLSTPPSTDPISGPTFLKVRLQPKGDKGRRGIWVAFLGDDFVRPKFHTGGA